MMKIEALNSKTLVDLALLGLLSGRRQTPYALIQAVKQAGSSDFTPTAMFIEDRMRSLVNQNFVQASSDDDQLHATPDGLAHITQLLRLELDPTAAMLRIFCATLKLCLLELVDSTTRTEIVQALCMSKKYCPMPIVNVDLPACPMMIRYLAIEQKRQVQEKRFWQDTLLEEGLLDPTY